MSSLRDPDMDVWGLRKEDPAWIEAPNPAPAISELLDLLRNVDDGWMREGWCSNPTMLAAWGIGPDAWFSTNAADIYAAKQLCEACPVRTKCLQHAVSTEETWGVWGGRGPKARTRIRNRGGDLCAAGHEYTSENTKFTKSGSATCRACERERQAAARAEGRYAS